MKTNFPDFQAAMNDELGLPYGMDAWLSLLQAETRRAVREAEDATARVERISKTLDSVRPIKGVE